MRAGFLPVHRRLSDYLLADKARSDFNPGWAEIVYALLIVLSTIGYPLSGLLTTVVLPGQTAINYAFRLVVVGLALTAAIYSLLFRRKRQFSLIIFLFFCLYSYRLYYDALIDYLPGADLVSYYFFGTVVIPVFAVGVGTRLFDDLAFAFWTFVVSAIECAGILMVMVFAPGTVGAATEEQGRLSFDALNPITIGYTGVTAVLSAIYLWPRASRGVRFVLATTIAIGGYIIILSGSRGPLVALLLAVAYLMAVRGKIGLLILTGMAGLYAAFIAADQGLSIVARFTGVGTLDDQSSAERLDVMHLAVDQAVANPLFGHAYAETTTMSYPHNLFVESAMAIGVVGLLLMIAIQARMIWAGWFLGRKNYAFLGMNIVVALVNANLSGSIWQSASFWVVAILSFAIPDIVSGKKRDDEIFIIRKNQFSPKSSIT